MVEPPENHENLPHNVTKHYYMQMAEIMGKEILHDDYCALAGWMITKISFDRDSDFIVLSMPSP